MWIYYYFLYIIKFLSQLFFLTLVMMYKIYLYFVCIPLVYVSCFVLCALRETIKIETSVIRMFSDLL